MYKSQYVKAYSINEASRMLSIPSGTLRQWEKDLQGILVIPRTKQGARYYTDTEIGMLKKIKEMREQNVSKGIIRSLFEKHLNLASEEPSKSLEMTLHATEQKPENKENFPAKQEEASTSIQDFYAAMETFKHDLLQEMKSEIQEKQQEMMVEIKTELSANSLQTVKNISKSIQRSNEKRKTDMHALLNDLEQHSERTSEAFTSFADRLTKTAKENSGQQAKQIAAMSQKAIKEQKHMLLRMNQSVSFAKNEIRNMAKTLQQDQKDLQNTVNEVKQTSLAVQQREKMFTEMVASFREAAVAKKKKHKWWRALFNM
ncbi:MerR family transcriptional regulator [Bacillaceae bacterium Marseille-Q3522]|nr:MerR family transcriptional regulator [Bacillaceae bacterium Marseille-Q3522]